MKVMGFVFLVGVVVKIVLNVMMLCVVVVVVWCRKMVWIFWLLWLLNGFGVVVCEMGVSVVDVVVMMRSFRVCFMGGLWLGLWWIIV